MTDNIILLNDFLNYDKKYDNLSLKVYKILCNGFPFHEGIHNYFLKNIASDGFISVNVLLNIFNNNLPVFKSIFNELNCDKLNEYEILMVKYNPYFSSKIDINKRKSFFIRSKYNHTISHVKPSFIFNYELNPDFLPKIIISKKIHKDNLEECLNQGISNQGKNTIVLETQFTKHNYQELENENDIWKTLEINIKPLLETCKFYLEDDKVLMVNESESDFKIDPSFISIL